MSVRTVFEASSETATASIAVTRESIAYNEGIVAVMAAAEMERVSVPRSRDARSSSESAKGRVDVRGVAAMLAPSTALADIGVVTRIVGGCLELDSFDGVETEMCRSPEYFDLTGDSGIPAAPTRAGGGSLVSDG